MLLRGKAKKEKGILLPLFSLPSRHGIGSLGKEAYDFVDFLRDCGQDYWQILPLCPVGKGNSPYSSPSSFAGEILYIDLDILCCEGWLKENEIPDSFFSDRVDYAQVKKYKLPLLRKVAHRFDTNRRDYKNFIKENDYWLSGYALFSAIKESKLGLSFLQWERELKFALPEALKEFEKTHQSEIEFYKITQFLFRGQYNRLRNYANASGIKIIGDLPFYVSKESADVWQNSEVFRLGRDMSPILQGGVPPDIFSSTGQLWENPIYDWDFLEKTNYRWWGERLKNYGELYDVIRIDHFRAFAEYYAVAARAENAGFGNWHKGPGINFFESVKPYLKGTKIIAEDLGGEDSVIVQDLIKQTGFPNMKVLQFAFSTDGTNLFLPENFGNNCVCYTGTHDNDTTIGWYENLSSKERIMFEKIVPQKFSSPSLNLIAFGMKSAANTVIVPFFDYLESGSEARINTPGTSSGNWEWRFKKEDINEELIKKIIKVSKR